MDDGLLRVMALEVWEQEQSALDLRVIVVTRAQSGVYTVASGAAERRASVVLDLLDRDTIEEADLAAALGSGAVRSEYGMEGAARKRARHLLGTHTQASSTDLGWEPAAGWQQVYTGKRLVQHWDRDARRVKAERKIEQITKEIDQAAKAKPAERFSNSNEDFAARRRRKIELIQSRKRLKEMHGGDNADS